MQKIKLRLVRWVQLLQVDAPTRLEAREVTCSTKIAVV